MCGVLLPLTLAPGCVRSPRKPSVPHRVHYSRPNVPAAQIYGFALRRSNPGWLAVRAQRTLINSYSVLRIPGGTVPACNQVSWLHQPQSDIAGTVPLIAVHRMATWRRQLGAIAWCSTIASTPSFPSFAACHDFAVEMTQAIQGLSPHALQWWPVAAHRGTLNLKNRVSSAVLQRRPNAPEFMQTHGPGRTPDRSS